MGEVDTAGCRARDRLLKVITVRLRARKDTRALAEQISGLHRLICDLQAPPEILRDGDGRAHPPPSERERAARLLRVAKDRIAVFARRKRWERAPSHLQLARIKWDTATQHFELFEQESVAGLRMELLASGPMTPAAADQAIRERWADEIRLVWETVMKKKGSPLAPKAIAEALAAKNHRTRAGRLVFEAFGNPKSQELADFLRQLKQVTPKLWP